jgi:hypothetical protein
MLGRKAQVDVPHPQINENIAEELPRKSGLPYSPVSLVISITYPVFRCAQRDPHPFSLTNH